MPKEAKEAQEVENDLKVDTDANLRASEEASELESAQEANEQEAKKNSEKGFFAKAVDKAKEATSELFSTESSQEQKEAKQTTQATPKLKSILKKGVKFTSVTAFLYKGEGEFILKIGAYPYIIQSGEVFIVPNDKTAQYLRYKEQLFSEITE